MSSIDNSPLRDTKKMITKRQNLGSETSQQSTHEYTIPPENNDIDAASKHRKLNLKNFAWKRITAFPFLLLCILAVVPVFKAKKPRNQSKNKPTNNRPFIRGLKSVKVPNIDDSTSRADKTLLKFLMTSSVGRKKVREMISRDYAHDSTPAENPNDLLEYALESLLDDAEKPLKKKESTPKLSDAERSLVDFLSSSELGRDIVRSMLVKEFVSDETMDEDPDDLLGSAIEAIDLYERDYEPVNIQGYPFLFVGSVGAAMNADGLHEHGITHVVNWSSTAKCDAIRGIKYFCVYGVRNQVGMINHLDEAVEFIESARKEHGKVMSQCWYGRNRSVTLLIAYLMKYQGLKPEAAFEIIKRSRPEAEPYMEPLMEYMHFLRSGRNNRDVAE